MPEVGFEPTPTNRIELKSTALDHSAIQAVLYNHMNNDHVAQLDSALDFESNGCGFESRRG